MKLLIKDAGSDWDGTGFAAMECNLKNSNIEIFEKKNSGQKELYIQISGKNKTIAARLKYIKSGHGFLLLDRYLRRDLELNGNQEVEVNPINPENALEVTLNIPGESSRPKDYAELCYTYMKFQPLTEGQTKPIYLYSGEEILLTVESVKPNDYSILTHDTNIKFIYSKSQGQNVFFSDIGGLDNEINLIRERVEIPLKHSDDLSRLGIYPPRGVLLIGPPGCGKTMIARALSSEIGANLFEISGPEIFNPLYGESEKKLREIIIKAKNNAPSIILIDELDAIASSRKIIHGELEKRIVTTLMTEMDGLSELKNVVVVATTNDPNVIDSALRRPGRFDYEIRIGIPNVNGRKDILNTHTRKLSVSNREDTLKHVAERTYGYTGADLMLLSREAAYHALKSKFPQLNMTDEDLTKISELEVNREDFEIAMNRVKPTGMREFQVEIPTEISWDQLGGLKNIKKTLVDEVIKSITNPDEFEKAGVYPVKGILLYGPPGTGKTLLAKVVANQAGANFISIRGPEIFSKWFGESEQKIREIFEKAREISPCIIFFDEIDAITSRRDINAYNIGNSVVNQLLTEMDGISSSKGVYVMAATGYKELLDPAILRPGRFDYHIEVPLPGKEERKEIFSIHLKNKSVSKEVDLEKLSSLTESFSGAHIAEVCRRAGMDALREAGFDGDSAEINMKHLMKAVKTVISSIKSLEKPFSGVEVV